MRLRPAILPVIGLVAGVTLGTVSFRVFNWKIPPQYAPYLSVAALAALDTAFGGIRAGIEGRFQNDIFASGFVLNSLLAALLAWAGDQLGINLALVAVLVLGTRVFNNLSLMRRFYLNKLALSRKKQQEEVASNTALSAGQVLAPKSEIGGF
jgi:small basic protein